MRDFVEDDGIGIEAVIIGKSELSAPGVVKRDDGLEPARHRIGKIGDKVACLQRDNELFTFLCMEDELIHLSREDAPIQGDGQGDGIGVSLPWSVHVCSGQEPDILEQVKGMCFRFKNLGEVANYETHRVAHSLSLIHI